MSPLLHTNAKKQKTGNTRMRSKIIFYCVIMVLPLLQFCVFYIYTHINSFCWRSKNTLLPRRGEATILLLQGLIISKRRLVFSLKEATLSKIP